MSLTSLDRAIAARPTRLDDFAAEVYQQSARTLARRPRIRRKVLQTLRRSAVQSQEAGDWERADVLVSIADCIAIQSPLALAEEAETGWPDSAELIVQANVMDDR